MIPVVTIIINKRSTLSKMFTYLNSVETMIEDNLVTGVKLTIDQVPPNAVAGAAH